MLCRGLFNSTIVESFSLQDLIIRTPEFHISIHLICIHPRIQLHYLPASRGVYLSYLLPYITEYFLEGLPSSPILLRDIIILRGKILWWKCNNVFASKPVAYNFPAQLTLTMVAEINRPSTEPPTLPNV